MLYGRRMLTGWFLNTEKFYVSKVRILKKERKHVGILLKKSIFWYNEENRQKNMDVKELII